MKEFNFKKLDAFTTGLASGNPAAYIHLSADERISEDEMQQIAFELGDFVCETAFVRPLHDDTADFDFRFFSKEKEVPFCGHATIAVCHDLIRESENLAKQAFFTIKTAHGLLQIFNAMESENSVYIESPLPVFHECTFSGEETASLLNLKSDEIDYSEKTVCLSVGQKILLVPLKDNASVRMCSPDYNSLRNFSEKTGIDVIVIYSSDTVFEGHDFRTRVFPPGFGYYEDPATGSGNAALGYHQFLNCGREEDKITIEQGTSEMNPNIIKLKRNGQSILIGGSSVLKLKGKYSLCL